MKKLPSSIVAVLLYFLFIATPASFARQLVEVDGLHATVDQNLKCAENVSVNIDTYDASVFQGDRIKLQKLMGGVRVALDFECNNISRINIIGKVNGEAVYHAHVQGQDGWRLTDVTSKIETSTISTLNADLKEAKTQVTKRVPDSIDGFYRVGNQGIRVIKAQKDNDGDYIYEETLLEGLAGKKGELYVKGYWFPESQVIVYQSPFTVVKDCPIYWSENIYTEPLINTGNGIWEIKPDKTKPICLGHRYNSLTCTREMCNIWSNEEGIQALPDSVDVLVKDETIARAIYSRTNKRKRNSIIPGHK